MANNYDHPGDDISPGGRRRKKTQKGDRFEGPRDGILEFA